MSQRAVNNDAARRPDALDCDWRFDSGMWIVPDQSEIVVLKLVELTDGRVELHSGEWPAIA